MYKKVITMTGWRRPDYTKQVIDNLRYCIGFEDYILLPTIEPGYPELLKAFSNLPNCNLIVNDQRLGCAANTLKALQRGFDISDFVIHMEDDTVPGIDSLKYFEYLYKTYKDDRDIFTVTAYNRTTKIGPTDYFTLYRCQYFTGWMWGTWKDRFEEMKEKWDFNAWDIGINKKIRKDRYEICPTLSRSKNIGELMGTYTTSSHWRKCQRSDTWVNNVPGISNIFQSTILPSNLSNNIEILPYFESTNTCLPCYDPGIGITIIGIGLPYLYGREIRQ